MAYSFFYKCCFLAVFPCLRSIKHSYTINTIDIGITFRHDLVYYSLNKCSAVIKFVFPISVYLFILVLEIVFNLIKQNKDIHGLTFFDHTFLYTAYADDTTFFLKDKESVKKVMNIFDTFSIYSGLKPNKSKCEIAGIGVRKGVSMELCGMECIDLTKNSVKILGIHFSYNKKIENEENFIKLIKKIYNALKI